MEGHVSMEQGSHGISGGEAHFTTNLAGRTQELTFKSDLEKPVCASIDMQMPSVKAQNAGPHPRLVTNRNGARGMETRLRTRYRFFEGVCWWTLGRTSVSGFSSVTNFKFVVRFGRPFRFPSSHCIGMPFAPTPSTRSCDNLILGPTTHTSFHAHVHVPKSLTRRSPWSHFLAISFVHKLVVCCQIPVPIFAARRETWVGLPPSF